MYDEQVLYKKEMIAAQKELEQTKDAGLKYEVNKKISKYKNLQMAKKIQLNSA